jgi:hypothetical protein
LSRNQKSEEWLHLIDEYQNSGLSVAVWCHQNQKNINTFRYWLRKIRNENPISNQEQQWVAVSVKEDLDSPRIKVKLGIFVIEISSGFDQKLLADIVTTLQCLC